MIRFGLDSTSMVPVAAHHAVGSTVAIRYLGHDTSKVITRSEHAAYRAAGIDVFLVFEDGGRPDLSGYDGGKANAQFGLAQASERLLELPRPPRIAFAWDSDPNADPAAADAYYDGVAAVMGHDRCGPYGGKAAVSHLANRGFKVLWQTYAWSAGQWDDRARVRQYSNDHAVGGVGVDFDHIIPGPHGDFGQLDYRPRPADPHHYHRFDAVHRSDLPPPLLTAANERAVVKLYDKYRAQQTRLRHPHRWELSALRHQLGWLSGRIVTEARKSKPPAWLVYHRHWRFQQLTARRDGRRMA